MQQRNYVVHDDSMWLIVYKYMSLHNSVGDLRTTCGVVFPENKVTRKHTIFEKSVIFCARPPKLLCMGGSSGVSPLTRAGYGAALGATQVLKGRSPSPIFLIFSC